MRNQLTRVIAGAGLLLAMTLSGCAAGADSPDSAAPSTSGVNSMSSQVPTEAKPLLARYGLGGMDSAQIIDHLDRLAGKERPDDLMASVRPGELVLSAGKAEYDLALPDDRFYLSFAPYVQQTHECFFHSLTTCQGELVAQDVRVQITDDTNGEVLADETRTTFANGFVGVWLPRDIEGTLRVTYDGQVGEVEFATTEDAPTCLTTLRLV
jgi:hypothetical protein